MCNERERMTQNDLLTRSKKKKSVMNYIRTPKEIWAILKNEFTFSVDACASHKNYLVKKYWTKEDNALTKDWDNETIYCHPMYDHYIPKFIEKAFQHDCLIVFLLPASTNSVYFHTHLWDGINHKPKKNVQIRFLKKPKGIYGYKFLTDDDDEPETGYLKPLMVVVIDNRRNNETA
jgi:phage N-6-adenine-methyltransferase|tara:strand:- start:124 stop:651 length:528 start_codon:yes stop_codon:yes gene_type:complete